MRQHPQQYRMLEFVRQHQMQADPLGVDSIVLHVNWSRRLPDGTFETGVEDETISTWPELLAGLGY